MDQTFSSFTHRTPPTTSTTTTAMAHPRIEEVDDVSDPDEMDLDAFDFARPGQTTLQQAQAPQQRQQQQQQQQQPNADMMAQMQALLSGGGGGDPGNNPGSMDPQERLRLERAQQEKSKAYQCIYPIYFDAARSREQGRRVSKADAVKNPLAREIVDALQWVAQQVGFALQIVFEPSKCHPKDWANPGRVRVEVKRGGEGVTGGIKNSKWFPLISWRVWRREGSVEQQSNKRETEALTV